MKLRSIFLSAIALAFTASFTACDKDDDKDSNINLYQTWKIIEPDEELDDDDQIGYYQFTKDSLILYLQPRKASAGYSTDSLYRISAMPQTSTAICTPDSAVATGILKSYTYKFIIRRESDAAYTLEQIFTPGTATADTTWFDILPATGLNFSSRKVVDD